MGASFCLVFYLGFGVTNTDVQGEGKPHLVDLEIGKWKRERE